MSKQKKHSWLKESLFVLSLIMSASTYAQKGTSQFSVFGGYEYFPELWKGDGYNLGIEFKQYVHDRIYVSANFHAGINDGSKTEIHTIRDTDYKIHLTNSVRDYMLGFGLGGDLLHLGRHKLYMQGTAGIGVSNRQKDNFRPSPGGEYNILKAETDESTRFAVSASAGYDYQLTKWLTAGVCYTGWQIGYSYKNSANVKIGVTF